MKRALHNQDARDRLASLMRALYTNRITNLEFDERAEKFAYEDAAAFQVFWKGAWLTYDDFKENRFTGERTLTREGKRTVARWILFLKSGQSYEWPAHLGQARWTFWIALAVPIPLGLYFGRWDVLALSFIIASLFSAFSNRSTREESSQVLKRPETLNSGRSFRRRNTKQR